MIEVKNLTKRYGKTVALENFNLSIATHSIFGLVGINGAGKSTLLRILAGVMRSDEGEVLVDGEPIYENEGRKKQMFFLPDELYFTPNMNANRMAEFYKAFYAFDEKVFLHYLNLYRLNPLTSLRNFSKGMRRQLFVCLAFAACPKYLLLDEAFDGLDPAARLVFKRGLIEAMEKSNGTAIISSHSLRELEDICDAYGIIDGKKIVSYGSLNESLENTYKFQIAFKEPLAPQMLGFTPVSFEQNGRVVKVIVRGDKNEILQKIHALNPLLVDEIPVDFEEFFISEVQRKGGNLC